METFLYIVFFLSCVLLIVSVLLQPGKTDAGALFTSNISSAALNPRGTQSVLSKMTIAMATIFMLSALLLALPAVTGKVSVLETQGESTKPATTDAGAANSNTTAPANSSGTASNTESAKPAEPKKEETAKPAEDKKDPASKEDAGKESK